MNTAITKLIILAFTLACLSATCYPQTQQLSSIELLDSIVGSHVVVTRIESTPNGEKTSVAKGSGTVIGHKAQRTYILTTDHIRYAGRTKREYSYELGVRLQLKGPSIKARIERFSKHGLDAIIISTTTLSHPVAKVSRTDPGRGEELLVLGSPTGSYRLSYRRKVDRYRRAKSTGRLYYQIREFILDGPILNGFSGGGVYNNKGEFVGMCYRHISVTNDTGVCLPISVLREIIQQYQ